MSPTSVILLFAAIVGAQTTGSPVGDDSWPDSYGPWESNYVANPQDGVPLRCNIRYASDKNEIQWGVNVGTDGAEVLANGLNRYNCRPMETREAVMLEFGSWSKSPNPDIKSDAMRILDAMQLHRNFFGDCYNASGRTAAISPSILKAATPDFVRAFIAADRQVRKALKRSQKSSGSER